MSFLKYGGNLGLRQFFGEHWHVFANYDLVIRDSNQDTGLVYRDYLVHMIVAGVGAAF